MKVFFASLGCDKNLSDTEQMLGILISAGHEIVGEESEAEAIIVNTCCFIKDARDESVETILEMTEYKKAGSCRILIVTGCMAERYQQEILDELPEVDAVLGTSSYDHILEALEAAEKKDRYSMFCSIDHLVTDDCGQSVSSRPADITPI